MQTIKISVNNRIASAEPGAWVVRDNGACQIQFAFDAEWDSYSTKKAVFIWCEGDDTVRNLLPSPVSVSPCRRSAAAAMC